MTRNRALVEIGRDRSWYRRRRAAEIAGFARGHWGGIGNGLHWVLDVVFREGHAGANLGSIRGAAVTLLETSARQGQR